MQDGEQCQARAREERGAEGPDKHGHNWRACPMVVGVEEGFPFCLSKMQFGNDRLHKHIRKQRLCLTSLRPALFPTKLSIILFVSGW